MKVIIAAMVGVLGCAAITANAADRGRDYFKLPKFSATGVDAPRKPAKGRTAVVVTFDSKPYTMVFKLPWVAGYVTPEGVICAQGYSETFDKKRCNGCAEICQDTQSRYARMWIEHQSAGRIVVRTRGALCDRDGKIAHRDIDSKSPYGKGDWADEWFRIYPDGTCTRTVTIYTGMAPKAAASWGRKGHPFECQETIIQSNTGRAPTEDIDVTALTLITMDGRIKSVAFKPYPQAGQLLKGANIQIVNLKSCHKPFTIVQDDDVTISPYYGPDIDREHIDKRVFVGWPRGAKWGKGYTVALSHVVDWKFHKRTENTLIRTYLLGMTAAVTKSGQAGEILPIARAWLKAPELKIASKGYKSLGFDRTEKAWIIEKTHPGASLLTVEIAATKDRPVVNPCIVIRNCNRPVVSFQQGGGLRTGFEKRKGRTDLVIWRRMSSTEPVRFSIKFGSSRVRSAR
ncbi:MAG: hypothetical protein QGH60_04820 [Phycisphaerae bacterium]|jgi:hypothetical protein|nr:hypothetical protein [Phycisphaerae bacterium]